MKIHSILKIGNISPRDITESLKNKLEEEGFARLSDNKEVFNIYSAWDILHDEELDTDCFTPEEMKEIETIDELLVENDCDYFRIIE